jgi:hypothetical protein
MKNLAALVSIATLGLLPVAAAAHAHDIFHTDLPSPQTAPCLLVDCCDLDDATMPDSINGPFTPVCELLYGPDIGRPNFLKEKPL